MAQLSGEALAAQVFYHECISNKLRVQFTRLLTELLGSRGGRLSCWAEETLDFGSKLEFQGSLPRYYGMLRGAEAGQFTSYLIII